jgi:hypothetical protein
MAAVSLRGGAEASCTGAGPEVRVNQGDTASWYFSRRVAEGFSGFKVLVEEPNGRILGSHLFRLMPKRRSISRRWRSGRGLTSVDGMLFAYPDMWIGRDVRGFEDARNVRGIARPLA